MTIQPNFPSGHPLARRKGWLFDLDGTLIDSSPGVILAFHAAQRAFGEPLADPHAIRSRIGYPLVDAVLALSKVDYAQFIECFRREALASMHLHSRLLPGARELLDQLARQGRPCALVTSKRSDIARRIVDHLEIKDRFVTIIGSDATAHVKPHPAPLLEAARRLALDHDQLVMVGDTQNDIQAARAAGLPVIALASGFDPRSRLTGADLCFDDARRLLEFLRVAQGEGVMTKATSLVVFSKHDCGLCDELKDRLRHWQIPFEEYDIRLREDWFERYRERVPVVQLPDGKEHDPPFAEALLQGWATQNI